MAIISIILGTAYNGYIMLIKQTKAAEIRQIASLSGKKTLEEIRGGIDNGEIEYFAKDNKLVINNSITLEGSGNSTDSFSKNIYLNEKYEPCNEDECRYIETLELTKTKAKVADSEYINITLDKNYSIDTSKPNNSQYRLYISEEKSGSEINDYIRDNKDANNKVKLNNTDNKIILNVYIETKASQKNVKVEDYQGTSLVNTTYNTNLSLFINFNEYMKLENSNLKDVEVNVYNREADTPNIYIERDNNVKVNTVPCKGNIKIYDNRSGSSGTIKNGTLYDIKDVIIDKKNSNEVLFTGYSKQNIHL